MKVYEIVFSNRVYPVEVRADLRGIPDAALVALHNERHETSIESFPTRDMAEEATMETLNTTAAKPAKAAKAPADPKVTAAPKAAKEPKVAAAPKAVKEPKVAAAPKATFPLFNLDRQPEIKQHRLGTKRAMVLDATQGEGATFEQIKALTGWDHKTAYEGVRLMAIYLGYGLKTDATTGVITSFPVIPVFAAPEPKAAVAPKTAKTPAAATETSDSAAAAA